MKTLVFFGAGATASLNAPITWIQEQFFKSLIGNEPIEKRIKKFFKEVKPKLNARRKEEFIEDFKLTLQLLYDGDGKNSEEEASKIRENALNRIVNSISREFSLSKEERASLEHFYYIYVFPYYDWLAFKSIAKEILRFKSASIQDVLTVLTKAALEGISIPTPELFTKSKRQIDIYVNYRSRLEGALRVYKLLIFKLFKHLLRENEENNLLTKYKSFVKNSIKLARGLKSERTDNDIGEKFKLPISLATLNWDPIFPFLYLKEIRDINKEETKRGWRYYLSYGTPFMVKNLNQEDGYIIDEDAAFYTEIMTNEKRKCKLYTRIMKFFVPHGLMNMKTCPNCQNIFLIFPDKVGKLNFKRFLDIFLLDPIPTEEDIKELKNRNFKHFNLKDFLPSQINCPYCKTPTFFQDTFLQIQSILKPEEPPSIRKSYFDYAKSFSKAKHLVFIGYSFPIDDIPHLLTLMTLSIGNEDINRKFSLILYKPKLCSNKWLSYEEAKKILQKERDERNLETLKNVLKLSKKENIRINFCGFPTILDKMNIEDILLYR
ncbi:hypothetical protein [Thermovibrio sp.]